MVYSKHMQDIYQGNAFEDGKDTRGWIVGDFLPAWTGLHKTPDVEIKWTHHEAGAHRADWAPGTQSSTLGILISGNFRCQFRDKTVDLTKQGDYVLWGPGVDHNWEALADSIFMTVRWPSVSDMPDSPNKPTFSAL